MILPRILIVHTLQWPNAARLALAFRKAGCRIHALCLPPHPLRRLSAVEQIYAYNRFTPLRSLKAAIRVSAPDFIVPCDDVAVFQLHRLHSSCSESADELSRRTRAVIERSLGRPDAYPLLAARSNLSVIAAAADVLLPVTALVSTPEELRQWLRQEGYPAALKADRTWGGRGVVIIRTAREVEQAFRRLSGLYSFARVAKQLTLDANPQLLYDRLRGMKSVQSVQRFINGKLANCAVACWQGEIMAAIGVEVIALQEALGNASVVRVVDNPEMLETARRVVRHLGMSGFCGFDFVLEEPSGRAWLIEINPRATQINHLPLGTGHDLPTAIRARIVGEPIPETLSMTDRDLIALFPQELRRNPKAAFS
jgi:hypothetical protein